MSNPAKPVYEFGPFRLDPAERLLLRAGTPVSLTPKVFDTLLVLVENGGHLVEKDALMKRLWPDTFVEEVTLARNISDLRKALAEDSNGQKYINTVPKRGYRFVASVTEAGSQDNDVVLQKHTRTRLRIEEEEIDQDMASDVDAPLKASANLDILATENRSHLNPAPFIAARSWMSNRKMMATCALLAALIGVVTIGKIIPRNRQQSSPDGLASLRIKTLISWNSEAGEGETGARFSPKGTMIAYSLMKNGRRNIWTKQVTDGRPNPITDGPWNDHSPIWSHDGERIAFVSDRDNQVAIWMVPFSGGVLTLIKQMDDGRIKLKQWSKDGATIYYQLDFALFALDIHSKQITQLTNFDSTTQAQFFSISPNEDRIAYSSGPNGQLHLFVMPIGGDQPVQITHDEASDENPCWLPDGKRMIYSSKRDGIFQTCVAYLDERKTEQINLGISDTIITDISSDGRKILFEQSREEGDLWQVNVEEKTETQLTSDFGIEIWPDVSSDSKRIVFQTSTEEKHLLEGAIVIRSMDGTQQMQIAANGFNPTFSPDGSKVAFLRFADNQINIWMASNNGADERQLMTDDAGFDGFTMMPYNRGQIKDYSWSPDASSLIYCSKKSGLWNVWKVSSDGTNEPQQISNNTDATLRFSCPLFSPDGKHIAYLSKVIKPLSGAKPLTRVCLLTGENSEIVFSSESVLKVLGWTPSGSDLIIAMCEGNEDHSKPTKVRLLQVSAAGNNWNDIAPIESAYFDNIQLSADGRKLAYTAHEEGKDNIRVILSMGGENTRITENIDPNVFGSGIAWSPDGKAIYYSKQRRVGEISMIDNFK
jgi:Tol biopolymer transport system component/DNA-binding winged helix-turn-helix (wHTH) protein